MNDTNTDIEIDPEECSLNNYNQYSNIVSFPIIRNGQSSAYLFKIANTFSDDRSIYYHDINKDEWRNITKLSVSQLLILKCVITNSYNHSYKRFFKDSFEYTRSKVRSNFETIDRYIDRLLDNRSAVNQASDSE